MLPWGKERTNFDGLMVQLFDGCDSRIEHQVCHTYPLRR